MSIANVKSFSNNTRRGKKASEIRQLKSEALKQRMDSLNVGELEVALACGYERRDVVSRWRAGTNWPYPATEEKLEQALKVPKSFFTQIGKGMPYDEALRAAEAEEQGPDPEPLNITLDKVLKDIIHRAPEWGEPLLQQLLSIQKGLSRQNVDDAVKKR